MRCSLAQLEHEGRDGKNRGHACSTRSLNTACLLWHDVRALVCGDKTEVGLACRVWDGLTCLLIFFDEAPRAVNWQQSTFKRACPR
jgi:hypothetical protein